jgi:hypothetical protein
MPSSTSAAITTRACLHTVIPSLSRNLFRETDEERVLDALGMTELGGEIVNAHGVANTP